MCTNVILQNKAQPQPCYRVRPYPIMQQVFQWSVNGLLRVYTVISLAFVNRCEPELLQLCTQSHKDCCSCSNCFTLLTQTKNSFDWHWPVIGCISRYRTRLFYSWDHIHPSFPEQLYLFSSETDFGVRLVGMSGLMIHWWVSSIRLHGHRWSCMSTPMAFLLWFLSLDVKTTSLTPHIFHPAVIQFPFKMLHGIQSSAKTWISFTWLFTNFIYLFLTCLSFIFIDVSITWYSLIKSWLMKPEYLLK